MIDLTNLSHTIKGVFLLFIAITANFLGNSLNCRLQLDLTNSSILRNIFLYMIIIFTIDFTSKKKMDIKEILKNSLLIYMFYIMLSKQNYITMYSVIILLTVIYLIDIQIGYLKENKKDTSKLEEIKSILLYGVITITVSGFIIYFLKQHKEHKSNFDFTKFIFGTNVCDKLK